jgi:NAD(P)H-nitrite reductase large subunit
MRRLVVVGNGKAADVFLQQIRHYKHDFSITVFGGCMPHRRPAWYRNHGIDLRQEVLITAIDRHARVAQGSDGSRTTFDRLILATGNCGLIPPGLEARRGVLVNRSLETSDGHVYAIGDCAENRDAACVTSLDQQARLLAQRLVGESSGVEVQPPIRKLRLLTSQGVTSSGRARALSA